jgi:hypothetical protein
VIGGNTAIECDGVDDVDRSSAVEVVVCDEEQEQEEVGRRRSIGRKRKTQLQIQIPIKSTTTLSFSKRSERICPLRFWS